MQHVKKISAYPSLFWVAQVDMDHGSVSFDGTGTGIGILREISWIQSLTWVQVWVPCCPWAPLAPQPLQRQNLCCNSQLGDECALAASHESVLIRAALPFCFVLNNPVFATEPCQELRDLTGHVGRSRAINCPGIHAVVNAGEEQAAHKHPATQIPIDALTNTLLHPAASLNISANKRNSGGRQRQNVAPEVVQGWEVLWN